MNQISLLYKELSRLNGEIMELGENIDRMAILVRSANAEDLAHAYRMLKRRHRKLRKLQGEVLKKLNALPANMDLVYNLYPDELPKDALGRK